MRRRRLLQLTGTALAASVAGCGQGGGDGTQPADEPDDTATPEPTPTETATPTEPADESTPTDTPTATPDDGSTPTATTESTPTPTATATPRDAAQVVEVGPDSSLKFAPTTFEISTGDTVVWVWRGGGHNVVVDTAPDGTDWEGTPGGESETYDSGYEHSHTFTAAGEYAYYCAPHEGVGMTGSFAVTE